MDLKTTYPTPRPGVIGQVLDGEAVLVLPERGKVEVLNEVGSFIWARLDGKQSIEEIALAICAEYKVELPQARADALSFLKNLEARGVLVLANQQA